MHSTSSNGKGCLTRQWAPVGVKPPANPEEGSVNDCHLSHAVELAQSEGDEDEGIVAKVDGALKRANPFAPEAFGGQNGNVPEVGGGAGPAIKPYSFVASGAASLPIWSTSFHVSHSR